MRDLIIIGAGGHAAECLWAAEEMGCWNVLGCVVYDPTKYPASVYGYPVLGTAESYAAIAHEPIAFLCGIGDNAIRRREVLAAIRLGWAAAAIINRTALVAKDARIGAGTYIAMHSLVSAGSSVGDHAIVNNGGQVGHDCQVGDYTQICPGVRISGRCRIGSSVFIGSNAVIAPDATIEDGAVIGACSFVRGHVPAGARMAGIPAKSIAR